VNGFVLLQGLINHSALGANPDGKIILPSFANIDPSVHNILGSDVNVL
jgi:hypothetical protein